jgi:hypothetical protein
MWSKGQRNVEKLLRWCRHIPHLIMAQHMMQCVMLYPMEAHEYDIPSCPIA